MTDNLSDLNYDYSSLLEQSKKLPSLLLAKAKKMPGFFEPYKGLGDISLTLISPVIWPLVIVSFTATCSLCTITAPIVCTLSLLLAAGSFLFGKNEFCETALKVAAISAAITALGATLSIYSALLTPITPFVALGYIISRCIGTMESPAKNTDYEILDDTIPAP